MKPTPSELTSRIIYNPNTGALIWRAIEEPRAWQIGWNSRNAGRPAFNHLSKRGYLNGSWKPYTLTAHRVAWAIYNGEWPQNQIDHINGNRTDNRIQNLRDVTNKDNSRNSGMKSNNKSGHTGVFWHSEVGKWTAQITIDGKGYSLGCFEKIEDAIHARSIASKESGFHANHGLDRDYIAATQDRVEGMI